MGQVLSKFALLGPGFLISVGAFAVVFALLTIAKYVKKHADEGIKAAKAASDAIDPTRLDDVTKGLLGKVSNYSKELEAQTKDKAKDKDKT